MSPAKLASLLEALLDEAAPSAADLDTIQQQVAHLKELIMSVVTDFQTFVTNANATMAAAVLTIQQLRQAYDTAQEQLAAAGPATPAGATVLTAEETAASAAAIASGADSRQALADAVEANALPQAAPPAP